MGNKSAKEEIKKLYSDKCMLTFLKGISYHHIQKKEDGGLATVDNGALLNGRIHQWLHNNIELHDRELYQLINECLILYKMCVDQNKEKLLEQYENEVVKEFRKRLIK